MIRRYAVRGNIFDRRDFHNSRRQKFHKIKRKFHVQSKDLRKMSSHLSRDEAANVAANVNRQRQERFDKNFESDLNRAIEQCSESINIAANLGKLSVECEISFVKTEAEGIKINQDKLESRLRQAKPEYEIRVRKYTRVPDRPVPMFTKVGTYHVEFGWAREKVGSAILSKNMTDHTRQFPIQQLGPLSNVTANLNKRASLLQSVNVNIFTKDDFKSLIQKGFTWNEMLRALVLDNDEDENSRTLMTRLVDHRVVLDCEVYESITESIFIRDHFTIRAVEGGHPLEGVYQWKWYSLRVYLGRKINIDLDTLDSRPCCEIQIRAPGSGTLTSDIDTTIMVRNTEHLASADKSFLTKLNFTDPNLKNIERDHLDYDGLIQTELIRRFNIHSRQHYHCTSGINRDSNVYSDGFLREGRYCKFDRQFTYGDDYIVPSDKRQFYDKFKLYKHQCEQAASLYSLKIALRYGEWNKWKMELLDQIRVKMGLYRIDDASAIEASLVDINCIISICESFESYATDLVKKTISDIMLTEYVKQSPYSNDAKKLDDDVTIYAMQELYVAHLAIVRETSSKITEVDHDIQRRNLQLGAIQSRLNQEAKSLTGLERLLTEDVSFARKVSKTKDDIVSLRTQIQELLKTMEEHLVTISELENQRQLQQVLANLFANEAYINHSAPYHVVNGMQSGVEVAYTIQIFMGSALQQLGFRLLHSRKLRSDAISEREILYKNAKYGYRTAHLVFNRIVKPYSDDEINTLRSKIYRRRVKIMSMLGVSDSANWDILLNVKEAYLLNSEFRIFQVTKERDKSITQRLKSISRLHQQRLGYINEVDSKEIGTATIPTDYFKKEDSLFLSIAWKIIVACYIAKILKKGTIWGHLTLLKKIEDPEYDLPNKTIDRDLTRLKPLMLNLTPGNHNEKK